jgi:hypothetical protein
MEAHRILFDQIEWQTSQPGARFKLFRDESRQVRLLELSPEFIESQWCEKGHVGLVVAGELDINFCGHIVRFPQGSALSIPAGETDLRTRMGKKCNKA